MATRPKPVELILGENKQLKALPSERSSESGCVSYSGTEGQVSDRQLSSLDRQLHLEMRLRGGNNRLVDISRSNRLKAGLRVGFVESDHVSVEVFPKWMVPDLVDVTPEQRSQHVGQARQSLSHLLTWCRVVSITPGPPVLQKVTRTSLSEWLLHAMARELVQQLTHGLSRGYQELLEPLLAVRGRIDIGSQIRQGHGLPLPMWCCYEEHTRDTPLGRCLALLAQIVNELARSQATSNLSTLAGRLLAPVRPSMNADSDLPRIRWTRNNERFRNSIRLLETLLSHKAALQQKGGAPSWSWSTSLDGVFERYVGRVLLLLWRQEAQDGESDFPLRTLQMRVGHLTAEPKSFAQKSDFVLRGTASTTIIDTKYKVPKNHRPSEADVRQVLVYASLWNNRDEGKTSPCKRIILLYPATDEMLPKIVRRWKSYLYDTGDSADRIELCVATIPFRGVPSREELESYRQVLSHWMI